MFFLFRARFLLRARARAHALARFVHRPKKGIKGWPQEGGIGHGHVGRKGALAWKVEIQ
jgi:hypothetical protein